MICLGLCVAHDAGIAAIEDGRVRGLIQRERITRHKRCALITAEFLSDSLNQFGLAWNEVDVVAISTSQSWPYLFLDPDRFHFEYDVDCLERFPFPDDMRNAMARGLNRPHAAERATAAVRHIAAGAYGEYFVDSVAELDAERNALWCYEWPYLPEWWRKPHDGSSIAQWSARIPGLKEIHQGYLPVRVTLDGVAKGMSRSMLK